MRFDLADLSLFRHVVEAGSITHGAERAHLALAAASTRIRNMEDVLGVPLLTRGRQGVAPTQAGRTLLQHARAILRQSERLHEDLSAYGGGLAGQIRVLSNTNALHFEMLRESYGHLLRHFDDLVLSYEVRAMKPQPEIYQAAVECAGCLPEECFYTDDIAAYVAAARAMGIDGVQFHSCEQIEGELRARGIKWD